MRGAYHHNAGMVKGERQRSDRRCSDCANAHTIPWMRRKSLPMVRCTAKHWSSEHELDWLPEEEAQSCSSYDDMDRDPRKG